MSQALIQKIDEAINKSEKLSESGWKMTFGQRAYEVCNLEQAKALKHDHPYRLEAVAFWELVRDSGHDMAENGRKAKSAFESGNSVDGIDFLYAGSFIERGFENYTKMWYPLYEEAKNGS